jgi:hypothetical protein
MRFLGRRFVFAALCAMALLPLSLFAQESALVHGLWVWKGPSVLDASRGAENLRYGVILGPSH